MTGEADGMNQGVYSMDGVMHYLKERSVYYYYLSVCLSVRPSVRPSLHPIHQSSINQSINQKITTYTKYLVGGLQEKLNKSQK